ncbi:hydantoinase B [Bordetella trematum]|nr:hydantoinase B [Bordetella trematum]
MSQIDEIRMQVMWNRLVSVVEEQALTLLRTAFSTSVREAGDLSAGVYNARGDMLAQAVTGTPGHVNTMAEAVRHFIDEITLENMYPGDTYVTNDPWKGTGHLHDITMVTPSFRDGRLVASLPARPTSSMSADAVSAPTGNRSTKKASRFPS